MLRFPNITLAILAGGKASRMRGENKALLKFKGQTFINLVYQNLSPLFARSIVIANGSTDFGIPDSKVYPDIIRGIGPLGGVHSALVNSIDPYVFIVSCDMPFADAAIAEQLSEEFLRSKPEILIPILKGFNEPLFALYSKCLSEKIEVVVRNSENRSLANLFKACSTKYYELAECEATKKCFTNINSLLDYNMLLESR